MRLIDADKLELKHFVQRVTEQPISYEGTQPIYANYDIIAYDVDNAPTVKAIPVNWIKNWCVKNYPTYPRIITEQLLKRTETWRMIEDWEKENEAN